MVCWVFILLWSFVVSWISFCALFEFQFYHVLFWAVWFGVLLFGDVLSSILFWVVSWILFCVLFCSVLLWCVELFFILLCSILLFNVTFYTTVVLYHIWICWVVFCSIFLLCRALFFVLLYSVQSCIVLFVIANQWALLRLMFNRLKRL